MNYNRFALCLGTGLAGVFLFFGAIPPLVYRSANAGAILLLVLGAGLLTLCLCWERCRAAVWRRSRRMAAAALGVVLLLAGMGSGWMLVAGYHRPPPSGATVIVLGCQVIDGKPSLMLARRLEVALAYLAQSPTSAVVCTGGYGAGSQYSEAGVMKRWLIERGIDPARIHLEEQASDTAQNISYSAALIRDRSLSGEVAIATDGFHQLRAALYVRREGLHAVGALPAETPWGLLPSYWAREWLALGKYLLPSLFGAL